MFDFKKTSPIANKLANKALKEIWDKTIALGKL